MSERGGYLLGENIASSGSISLVHGSIQLLCRDIRIYYSDLSFNARPLFGAISGLQVSIGNQSIAKFAR